MQALIEEHNRVTTLVTFDQKQTCHNDLNEETANNIKTCFINRNQLYPFFTQAT
jgi:hypothetical protein